MIMNNYLNRHAWTYRLHGRGGEIFEGFGWGGGYIGWSVRSGGSEPDGLDLG